MTMHRGWSWQQGRKCNGDVTDSKEDNPLGLALTTRFDMLMPTMRRRMHWGWQ